MVFFGKPFRKINKPTIVNYKNKKELVVQIWFEINNNPYHIIRGLNPQFFEIYENEKLINQNPNIRDYQDWFEKNILKMDFQMFIQLVILGKATYIAFFKLQLHERRKFIENILNLTIFGVMNEINKVKIVDSKNLLSQVKTELVILKEKINLKELHLESLKKEYRQQQNDYESQFNQQIKKHKRAIKEYEKQIKSIRLKMEVISDDLDTLNKKLETNYEYQSKLNDKIKRFQKRIEFFQKNETCPTCDTQLDEFIRETKSKELEEKKIELVNAQQSLKERIDNIVEVIRDIQQKLDQNKKYNREIESLENLIKQQHIMISHLTDNKEEMFRSNGSFDLKVLKNEEDINILKDEYSLKTDERTDILSRMESYNFISTMLKDSGIKAIIIKKYIPTITKIMNNYLRNLGLFVRFDLNENFEESFFARGVNLQNYYSFSEGEKLRIDLAMIMTWREVCKLQNNLDINFLIFDEILDASLDSSGSDNLLTLFEILTKSNVKIMVISHSADKWEDKFDKCLTFSKKSGFSRIEESK